MPPPGARVKASQRPSGDHSTCETWSSRRLTCSGRTPSVATIQPCGTPLGFDTKARRRPSGEKLGDQQPPIAVSLVTSVSRPPALPAAIAAGGEGAEGGPAAAGRAGPASGAAEAGAGAGAVGAAAGPAGPAGTENHRGGAGGGRRGRGRRAAERR